MASWQAHVMDFALRAQVKRKLRNNTDLQSVRAIFASGSLPPPKGATYTADTLGGVAGEWVTAAAGTGATGVPANTARPTLLYLHGGGYFACSPTTHRPITAAYALRGIRVFVPDYRLAPEHPFPAALEDAEAVWNALVASGVPPASITVSGDSAGGGLALALMLTLRDKGLSGPAAAALFSPWTDLAATGASIKTNAGHDALFWAPGIVAGAGHYLHGIDPKTPLASPLYADLHGLPPLLIHVGDREILRDDSTRFAERARAAGVSVDLRVWPVVPHVWQLAQTFVPEARQSIGLAGAFFEAKQALVG